MSLPETWVDRIFTKLSLVYGHQFLSRWDGLAMADVKADWAHELRGFAQNPGAISYALEHLPPGKAPTVLEFRAICNSPICGSSMAAPLKHGIVHHRGNQWGRSEWCLTPFDAPQAAIAGPSTANGWQPPAMVAPRAGSDVRLPKTAAPAEPQPAPELQPVDVPVFLASSEAEKVDMPEFPGSATSVEAGVDTPAQPDPEPSEPDAWFSARTGCVVLTDIELDEDGSITLLPQLVRAIVRMAREGVR
jgi:hypothetical protein